MDVGITIPHFGPLASPEFVIAFCRSAESAGFDALWAADHVVVPAQFESEYVLPATPKRFAFADMQATMGLNLEMNTTLAVASAVTQRVKLCTGDRRPPDPESRAQRQAGGQYRSLLGRARPVRRRGGLAPGGGRTPWRMPWDRRGRRVDEQISLLRTLWSATGETVEFAGEFYHTPPDLPRPAARAATHTHPDRWPQRCGLGPGGPDR